MSEDNMKVTFVAEPQGDMEVQTMALLGQVMRRLFNHPGPHNLEDDKKMAGRIARWFNDRHAYQEPRWNPPASRARGR